jgi:hypothetical protein
MTIANHSVRVATGSLSLTALTIVNVKNGWGGGTSLCCFFGIYVFCYVSAPHVTVCVSEVCHKQFILQNWTTVQNCQSKFHCPLCVSAVFWCNVILWNTEIKLFLVEPPDDRNRTLHSVGLLPCFFLKLLTFWSSEHRMFRKLDVFRSSCDTVRKRWWGFVRKSWSLSLNKWMSVLPQERRWRGAYLFSYDGNSWSQSLDQVSWRTQLNRHFFTWVRKWINFPKCCVLRNTTLWKKTIHP